MKKTDDLVRLAKSLRTDLNACQNEELEESLLLKIVEVVKGLGGSKQPLKERGRGRRRVRREEKGTL